MSGDVATDGSTGRSEGEITLTPFSATLRAIVEGKKPDEIVAMLPDIEEGVAAISETLAGRRMMTI